MLYREIINSPIRTTISYTVPLADDGSYESFIGEKKSVPKVIHLPCLYVKEEQEDQRTDNGNLSEYTGSITISPTQLQSLLGIWRLDRRYLEIEFQGRKYRSPLVKFEDEMFGSCLVVKIQLSSSSKQYGDA